MNSRFQRHRLSLLELATAVAIVATLAALGLPRFYEQQLRAKLAEVPVQLSGIRDAQLAYHAARGGYVTAPMQPATLPDRNPKEFCPGACPQWQELGWSPDGDIRGVYYTEEICNGTRAPLAGTCGDVHDFPAVCGFAVDGATDLDGDGQYARFSAYHDQTAQQIAGDYCDEF